VTSQRYFVIGDIHGCNQTFRYLIETTIALQKEDKLCLLGDYIDRGTDSKAVLDYCMLLQDQGYDICFLRGNHEQMMLDAFSNPVAEQAWLRAGGRATLKSFGVRSVREIDELYIEFLNALEYYVVVDDYILVHAGLNFDIKDPLKDKHAMLWSRNYEVLPHKIEGKRIIHGHTPYALKIILGQNLTREYEISVDAGCVFDKKKEGMGYMVALELNEGKFYHVKNMD